LKPPYKDIRNRFRTESLFFETYNHNELDTSIYQPVWTLKDTPKPVNPNHVFYDVYPDHMYPSLRQIYLEYQDPVEFTFATEVFGSDRHWKALCALNWFKPYVAEWREALELKIRSQNVRKVMEIAKSADKAGLSAAKWLAEKGYVPKEAKGRPSKQEIQNKLVSEVVATRMLEEDAERIGLNAQG
jgi:hypothetical protein